MDWIPNYTKLRERDYTLEEANEGKTEKERVIDILETQVIQELKFKGIFRPSALDFDKWTKYHQYITSQVTLRLNQCSTYSTELPKQVIPKGQAHD